MPDMTLDRFRDLADAYGGVIARWPADDRATAFRLAEEPAARAILAEAERLDGVLDRWTVPAPDPFLAARVLPAKRGMQSSWRRARLWWSGLGIATALAGAAAGSLAAAAILPTDPPADNVTAFGDLGGQEG